MAIADSNQSAVPADLLSRYLPQQSGLNQGMTAINPTTGGVNPIDPSGMNMPTQQQFQPSTWDTLMGYRAPDGQTQTGYLTGGAQLASSVLQGYLGLQQLSLGRQQVRQNRRQFNRNFEAQAQTTNANLEADVRRAASSSGLNNADTQQRVDSLMAKYGIKS